MNPCGLVQWGDVPGWITAVASIAALIFATIAARTASNLYRIESGRDREAEEERRERQRERRSEQASKISAWYASRPDNNGSLAEPNEYGAFIRNASELPIHNVHVAFIRKNEIEETPDSRIPAVFQVVDIVPPGDSPIFVPILREIIEEVSPRDERRNFVVAITFTDTENRRWRRDIHGQLMQPASAAIAEAK